MMTLNPLDIRQNYRATTDNLAEREPSYATAFPRANVGFPAFHRPAASTCSVSRWHSTDPNRQARRCGRLLGYDRHQRAAPIVAENEPPRSLLGPTAG